MRAQGLPVHRISHCEACAGPPPPTLSYRPFRSRLGVVDQQSCYF